MDLKTNKNTGSNNVTRIDFSKRCKTASHANAEKYEEYASPVSTAAKTPTIPPTREVGDLSLRRDEVMGERLAEIAGIDCGRDTVNVALALNGQAPDERWLKQLVITVIDEASGLKIGAPVATVTPSETGGFIHLKSLPFKGATPAPEDVSWGTIVRISGPRGWRLQAALTEMDWFNVMPQG